MRLYVAGIPKTMNEAQIKPIFDQVRAISGPGTIPGQEIKGGGDATAAAAGVCSAARAHTQRAHATR